MKFLRILFAALPLLALGPTIVHAAEKPRGQPAAGAELTKAQQQFLSGYEGVRAALAADDLAAAKRSAASLADSAAATEIAQAASIVAARTAFRKLSADAVKLAQGREGYYVATCPMARADWVQTSQTISNPYYGKSMLTCGSIKK